VAAGAGVEAGSLAGGTGAVAAAGVGWGEGGCSHALRAGQSAFLQSVPGAEDVRSTDWHWSSC
jgi:hypothetical protein